MHGLTSGGDSACSSASWKLTWRELRPHPDVGPQEVLVDKTPGSSLPVVWGHFWCLIQPFPDLLTPGPLDRLPPGSQVAAGAGSVLQTSSPRLFPCLCPTLSERCS